MLRRITAILVALIMCAMAFGALAQDNSEKIEISIFRVAHPSSSLDDLPEEGFVVDQWIENMFNVKLNVRYVPSVNSAEVYNAMMASRDIPTMVQYSYETLMKYPDAWATLNDYIIGKYENLEREFFDNPIIYAQSAMSNGDVKILSSLYSQYLGGVLLVRGDILKKYDIDMTSVNTKEEWHELLTFIKENEPDMIPYGTRAQRGGLTYCLCEGWSGIDEDFFIEDGVVKYGALDERLYPVIEWLRQLYSEGLIDVDYPTSDTTVWQEKVLGNGIFVTHDNPSSRIDWSDKQWESMGITDRYYQPAPPIAPAEGEIGYTTQHYPAFQDSWGISAEASPETIDRIMQIFDYCFTDEGFIISNWGVEGEYFDFDERGLPVMRPYYASYSSNNRGITLCFPRFVYNTLEHTTNERVAATVEMYEKGGLIRHNYLSAMRFNDDQQKIINTYYPDIETYMNEYLDGFIMGTKDFNEEIWAEFVSTLESLHIYDVLDVYNEAFEVTYALLNG